MKRNLRRYCRLDDETVIHTLYPQACAH
jgi:hypothetical protein